VGKSILDYAQDGVTLRDNQVAILEQVEAIWDRSDVVVIKAPVGSGKSHLANVIGRWSQDTRKLRSAILTHRVALQDQYERSFPEMPALAGIGRYQCPTMKMGCGDVREATDNFCSGSCHYSVAKTRAAAAPVTIYNYHVYAYLQDKRDVLICDEAHSLFEILSDMFSLVLWKHKEKYPDGLKTCGDVALWLEKQIKQLSLDLEVFKAESDKTAVEVKQISDMQKVIRKYQKVLSGLQKAPANFFIENTKGDYRGQMKEMLRVRPTTMVGLPPSLWNYKVDQKLILMSGTIGEEDIKKLGLTGRRIKYIEGANPIPADRRPVDVRWGVNMGQQFQDRNTPVMCKKIQELAAEYPDTKGLVHLTYGLAEKFKAHLTGPRYLWHTSENREEVLKEYLVSKGSVILMACGFSEGLDLAGEAYSWQAVCKVPYPSLGDQLVAKWAREDPAWYQWLCVRALEQMVGRICRGPTDYGKTFILDSGFGNPAKKRQGLIDRARPLFSKGFLESVIWQ
jgi:Rad3-related DNA helicase